MAAGEATPTNLVKKCGKKHCSEANVFNNLVPILRLQWSKSQFRTYWNGQDLNLVVIIVDITVYLGRFMLY
jgi:hypothetical protein